MLAGITIFNCDRKRSDDVANNKFVKLSYGIGWHIQKEHDKK